MAYKPLPSLEILRNKYEYNPETGELKHTIGQHKGRPVGSINTGYLRTISNGVMYKVHRIIWKMQTGEDPGQLTIDHINQDKLDNSWRNLRLSNMSDQMYNTTDRPTKNVYKTRHGKWQGIVTHKGKQYSKTTDCPVLSKMWVIDKRKELVKP